MGNREPEKMKAITFTGIRKVVEKANMLERSGKSVVHFEIGQPDFVTPKYIRDAACRALMEGHTRYTSNYGNLNLREEIAAKLAAENNMKVDPNTEIMVTCGGEEAVTAAILALVDADDEVILTDPGYSPYDSIVKIANAKPVFVKLKEEDNWNFDLAELENVITDRTRVLVFNTPANPTGTMMDFDSLVKLSEICIKHDILVLADEAYERVLYDENRHVSIASLPGMEERTITVQSFSKSYSMCGFRIGYLVACKELMQIIIRVHQKVVLCATSFAQDAAYEALRHPSDEIDAMLTEFNRRRNLIYDTFVKLNIPCNKPQAAFYVFPNVSCLGMDGDEFCQRFLDEYGVACVPGSDFGENGRGNIRLSYATSYEQCQRGMTLLTEFVNKVRTEKGLV